MKHTPIRLCILASLMIAGTMATAETIVPNNSFENGDLTGWTTGGTNRVAVIQGSDITGTGANVQATDGTYFAVISTGPNGGSGFLRMDDNFTWDYDPAELIVTVDIQHRPAVISFDWSFGTSEQDQPTAFDDLFDVSVYEGAPPADPFTGPERILAGSSPRNFGGSISNFPDAPIRGTNVVNWQINNAGPASGSLIRFGFHDWERACIGIPLPNDVPPPHARTIRFRAADQQDRGFDSALLIDNVEIRRACDATPQEFVTQITDTQGQQVTDKDGGLVLRQAINRRLTMDSSGTVVAIASNANLDGVNSNFIEQAFLRIGAGGWQRIAALNMQEGGEIRGMDFSGEITTGPGAGRIPGRYLAISASLSENDNPEIYLWDRYAETISQITNTNNCENLRPAINRGGTVLAFDSNCNVLTGAGSNRHIVVWSGGGTNNVNNASGTGNCIARNAHLNHHSDNGGRDGRYMVFESNCNYGDNGNGNFEIFRLRRDNNRLEQVSDTGGGILNTNPKLDRDSNGREVYYLSTQNTGSNPSGTMQLFRARCNNQNCNNINNLDQWTDNSATDLTISFDILLEPNPNSNAINQEYVFERLDLQTGVFAAGYRQGSSAASERIVSLQASLQGLAGGKNGGTPTVGIISPNDIKGLNPDGNPEVFTVRVEDP